MLKDKTALEIAEEVLTVFRESAYPSEDAARFSLKTLLQERKSPLWTNDQVIDDSSVERFFRFVSSLRPPRRDR